MQKLAFCTFLYTQGMLVIDLCKASKNPKKRPKTYDYI